jgi:hypothetical protein
MSVENILYQLLLEHDCVILPNFGGFIVRESPCNYNPSREIVKPYSKSIFFNQHLIENDGLLINAIARLKNITYDAATIEVETWVKKLASQLDSEGSLGILNIGNFTKGTEGNKWFAADSNLNLSLQTYGLRPVKAVILHALDLEDEAQTLDIKPLADNKPIEPFTIQRTNWKAWLAAASIAIVAHIGYLSIESIQNKNSNHASVMPMPTVSNTVETESIPVQEDTLITSNEVAMTETIAPEVEVPTTTTAIETAPVETIKIQEIPATPVTETTVFESESIQVNTLTNVIGRYKLEINAMNHVKDLAKKGINGTIGKNTQGLYEVTVPSEN